MGVIGSPVLIGGGKPFAVISVTYTPGRTCICSKGSKTLRAKDTSGKYVFILPESGTWTVSDGVLSRNATITEQYQIKKVSLLVLDLYDNGDVYQDVTGGWHGTNNSTYFNLGTFTLGPSYIQISRTGAQAVTAETVNKIDLTLFSTLKVNVTQRQTNMRLCVSANTPMGFSTESYIDLPSTGEYSLDVSLLSGEYYVGIATWGEGADGANRFDRVVLE